MLNSIADFPESRLISKAFWVQRSTPNDELMHKHDLVTCKKPFKTLRNNIKRSQDGFKQILPPQTTSEHGMYKDNQHFQMLYVFQLSSST